MKNTAYILFSLVFAAVVAGCVREEDRLGTEQALFLSMSTPGMYCDGSPVVVYDKYEHQLSTMSDGSSFRIQTDNLSQVVYFGISSVPAEGTEVEVSIVSEGFPTISQGTSIYECIKSENGSSWLWHDETRTGIIVPM